MNGAWLGGKWAGPGPKFFSSFKSQSQLTFNQRTIQGGLACGTVGGARPTFFKKKSRIGAWHVGKREGPGPRSFFETGFDLFGFGDVWIWVFKPAVGPNQAKSNNAFKKDNYGLWEKIL